MDIQEYVPRGRGRGLSHTECSMISPQKDGWNHFRPMMALIIASGFRVDDPIKIYRRGRDLVIEKVSTSVVKVKSYPHGNGLQVSWVDERLPLGAARGQGIKCPQATASKGKIVVPNLWR